MSRELPLLPYTVRVSHRARRVFVRLAPGRGVEVVVPKGTRKAEEVARRTVADKRAWIERVAARYRAQGLDLTPATPVLPEAVDLRAVNETWPVRATHGGKTAVLEHSGGLLLRGSGDLDAACAALRQWVRKRAAAALPERLRAVSRATGLDGYERVVVRLQRTRWGSLSARGTVSLNAKLLFLPPELADHVLLHELCHLEHRDHQAGFRNELGRHAPDWRRLERALRQAGGRYVPVWMSLP